MIRTARDTRSSPPDAGSQQSAAATAVPHLPFEATPADFQKQVEALAVGRKGDDR